MMNLRLKRDSRDQHFFHQYGGLVDFPPQSNFGFNLTSEIESPTEVSCTAYASCKVGASQTKKRYNVYTLWGLTPKTINGADIRDTLKTMCTYGLEIQGDTLTDKLWVSYFRVEGDYGDYFTSTQSAMTIAQSSAIGCSKFYQEWLNVPFGAVLPQGKTWVTNHAWEILDWTTIDGKQYFIVDFHTGGSFLMPREVYNKEMDVWGTGAWIPMTDIIRNKVQINLWTKILDKTRNVVLLLQQLIFMRNG